MKAITTKKLDRMFDNKKDISKYLDTTKIMKLSEFNKKLEKKKKKKLNN